MVLTLYKTPSPGLSIKSGEYYELALLDDKDNGGFVLKEFHGFWNEIERKPEPDSTSNIVGRYQSYNEGEAAFEKQKMLRAGQGFYHSLTLSFNTSTQMPEEIYRFIEVEP